MKLVKNIVLASSVMVVTLGNFPAFSADIQSVTTEVKSAASDTKVAVDDSVITTKIKAKMVADKATSARNIGVETKAGVVFLSGDVDTDSEAHAAIEIAASTEGVIDVDASKLSVQMSHHPIADSMITAKVKGAFVREKLFGDNPISVTGIHAETKDGVVYLTGIADSAAQSENAEKLAKSVNGVKRVESTVKIKP